MTQAASAEPDGDETPATTTSPTSPVEDQAVFSSSAPTHPTAPTSSITARLELGADGSAKLVEARISASHPYGGRSAVAHIDVPPDALGALQAALETALRSADGDARERAEEAALTHRIRARELGEDFHAQPQYVGPEVSVDDQQYSDPGLMALPKDERQAAIEAGVRAAPGGRQ